MMSDSQKALQAGSWIVAKNDMRFIFYVRNVKKQFANKCNIGIIGETYET